VIKKGAFQECHGVMTEDLGKGLKIIGARAFHACSSLHHINIPRGVRSIQKWAFSFFFKVNDFGFQQRSCGDWEICVVPPTVREIKEEAFLQCTQLSLVILQNGLEVIGSCAFLGTSIKSIKIPTSVTEIWDDAFEHCSNLTRVVFCDVIKNLYLERWWSIGWIKVSTKSA
jgi:hypothetical protein